MEADAFERISSALNSRLRRTDLPVRTQCGIDRIVWSVWDYIVGPELRFVWDIVPSELDHLTAPAVDSDSDASSVKTTSATTEGSAAGRSQDSSGEFISHYHENSLDPVLCDENTQFNASEFIVAEIHACGRCLKSDCRRGEDCVMFNVAEVVDRALKLADTRHASGHKQVNSPETSGSTSSPGDPLQSSQSTIVDSETSDSLADAANAPLANLKVSLIASTSSSSYHNESSHDDISTGMILSQHTDESVDDHRPNACSSPLQNSFISSGNEDRPSVGGSMDEGMEARSNASTVENGNTHEMSDEQYVAVHSLSSEVFRAHYSDDVEFKLINVPERRMAAAAYIFAAKHRDQPKAVHSLAFIIKDHRLSWFMKVKRFCTLYIDDFIPKLKAAFFVESYDEILTRMTTELTQIMTIFGELHTRSFTAWSFQVSDTLLSKPDLAGNDFIRFCISSHLQSQGQTIVVGDDIRKVNKMLRTLGFFMPLEERVLCLHALSNDEPVGSTRRKVTAPQCRYCPYLKLQGYPKSEVHFILQQLVYSPWPICLIDVDFETVAQSLPWKRHAELRRNALKRELSQILSGRNQQGNEQSKRRLLSEMKTGDLSETLVKRFLQKMDALPYDNRIREGFVRQFMRYLGHKAVALDVFVKEATNGGTSREGLRLSRLRRALDLESDGNFMTVIAIADQMRPGLMEFLMKRDG